MTLQPVANPHDQELERLLRQDTHLIRKVQSYQRQGRNEKARKARKHYLRSVASKAKAIRDVVKKDRLDWDADQIVTYANQISLRATPSDCINIKHVRKPNGGTRPIHTYTPLGKAKQTVVANLLKQCNEIPSHAYDVQGRGVHALIRDVKQRHNEGAKFIGVLDIKNFFGSLNCAAMSTILRIPRTVCEDILTIPFAGRSLNSYIQEGRRSNRSIGSGTINRPPTQSPIGYSGLPQGSAASPIVATLLLGDLGHLVPEGVELLAYRDDLIIVARRQLEVRTAISSLEGFLRDHPAGPLELGYRSTHQISQGVSFLGHHFKSKAGKLKVIPAGKGVRGFRPKLVECILTDIHNGTPPTKSLNYIRSWLAQYGECTNCDYLQEVFIADCDFMHELADAEMRQHTPKSEIRRRLSQYPIGRIQQYG